MCKENFIIGGIYIPPQSSAEKYISHCDAQEEITPIPSTKTSLIRRFQSTRGSMG